MVFQVQKWTDISSYCLVFSMSIYT